MAFILLQFMFFVADRWLNHWISSLEFVSAQTVEYYYKHSKADHSHTTEVGCWTPWGSLQNS